MHVCVPKVIIVVSVHALIPVTFLYGLYLSVTSDMLFSNSVTLSCFTVTVHPFRFVTKIRVSLHLIYNSRIESQNAISLCYCSIFYPKSHTHTHILVSFAYFSEALFVTIDVAVVELIMNILLLLL